MLIDLFLFLMSGKGRMSSDVHMSSGGLFKNARMTNEEFSCESEELPPPWTASVPVAILLFYSSNLKMVHIMRAVVCITFYTMRH